MTNAQINVATAAAALIRSSVSSHRKTEEVDKKSVFCHLAIGIAISRSKLYSIITQVDQISLCRKESFVNPQQTETKMGITQLVYLSQL